MEKKIFNSACPVEAAAGCFREKMIWELIEAVSGALSEIHGKEYGHFDVKPSNILWDGKRFILDKKCPEENLKNFLREFSYLKVNLQTQTT